MIELFLDRKESDIFAGPFFFVSYSHRDKTAVSEDVNTLMNEGARLWIDHRTEQENNMTYGDDWQDKVRGAIHHPNCVGALVYVSAYSLAGRATQWEHEQIKAAGVHTVFVSVKRSEDEGPTKVKKHFDQATLLCDEDDSPEPCYINAAYYDDILDEQKAWVKSTNLMILRTDSASAVAELRPTLKEAGIISDTAVAENKINHTNKESYDGRITLGLYKNREVYDVVPDSGEQDCRLTRGRETYLYISRRVYTAKPLSWRLLYTTKSAVHVFICCAVVEKCPAADLTGALEHFGALAFTEEQRKHIQALRILSPEDLAATEKEKLDRVLRLPTEQTESSWWIQKQGLLPQWLCLYKDNRPYGPGCLITLSKGLRPVIEIPDADLELLTRMP